MRSGQWTEHCTCCKISLLNVPFAFETLSFSLELDFSIDSCGNQQRGRKLPCIYPSLLGADMAKNSFSPAAPHHPCDMTHPWPGHPHIRWEEKSGFASAAPAASTHQRSSQQTPTLRVSAFLKFQSCWARAAASSASIISDRKWWNTAQTLPSVSESDLGNRLSKRNIKC